MGYVGASEWAIREPYAAAGGGVLGATPATTVTEMKVTPFDDLIYSSEAASAASELYPGKIIGFTIRTSDNDEPQYSDGGGGTATRCCPAGCGPPVPPIFSSTACSWAPERTHPATTIVPPWSHLPGGASRPPSGCVPKPASTLPTASSHHLEPDPAEPGEEGFEERVPTSYLVDASRSILAENDSPDIGFRFSLNPYRGCEHGCVYCYARPSHEYLGFSAGLDFETRILVKEQAPELLEQALRKRSWQPQVVALSGNTDCYQPVERRLQLTRRCLEVFLKFRNPVSLITKNHLVTRDLDILESMAALDLVHVTLSITSLDRRLTAAMEPRTSRPERRLQALQELSRAGVPAGVNVAPLIPGLNDSEAPAILEAAAARGRRPGWWGGSSRSPSGGTGWIAGGTSWPCTGSGARGRISWSCSGRAERGRRGSGRRRTSPGAHGAGAGDTSVILLRPGLEEQDALLQVCDSQPAYYCGGQCDDNCEDTSGGWDLRSVRILTAVSLQVLVGSQSMPAAGCTLRHRIRWLPGEAGPCPRSPGGRLPPSPESRARAGLRPPLRERDKACRCSLGNAPIL